MRLLPLPAQAGSGLGVRRFDLKDDEPPRPSPLLLWGGEGEKQRAALSGRRSAASLPTGLTCRTLSKSLSLGMNLK
jgi:hypothetical protein